MNSMDELGLDFDRLPAQRWGLIFTLLSMDLVNPFVGDMGLASFPFAHFQVDLRACILDYREHVLATGSPEPLPPRAFACLDAADAHHLFDWCAETFMYVMADQKSWYRWYLSLSRVVYDAAAAARLGEVLTGKLLTAARGAMDTDAVEARLAETKRSPLSRWDVEMYARHGFNDESGPDPHDIILSVVKIARTQQLMASLVEGVESWVLHTLRDDSVGYLTALGFDDPRSLPAPQDLVRRSGG